MWRKRTAGCRWDKPPSGGLRKGWEILRVSLLFLAFWAGFGWAAESDSPRLRISAGGHRGAVRALATDSQNRYLVSGSDDKTVQVWRISDGRRTKVLRPPISAGNDGRVFAVAMSPDGETVACGGLTGKDARSGFYIYLFHRESGELFRSLGDLPGVVTALEFSKDGRYLAVGLGAHARHPGRGNGIRVFETRNYAQVAADDRYAGSVYGMDFAPDGRLATVSDAGPVRLYQKNFRLALSRNPQFGKSPMDVAFDPSGARLAVGFYKRALIEVRDGKNLAFLYTPGSAGVLGNLSQVEWSGDGSRLFGGGKGRTRDKTRFIREWENRGRGNWVDYVLDTPDTLLGLLALEKAGDVVYSSAASEVGIVSRRRKNIRRLSRSEIMDFRKLRGGLQVSQTGESIQFHPQAGRPFRFSLSEGALSGRGHGGGPLRAPQTSAPGWDIRNWENRPDAQINGRRLPLAPHERSCSLAIGPDRASCLSGAAWHLRRLNPAGKVLWEIPVPGQAWAVNISGDGRIGVAALGDGTVRWYRMADGRELAVLLPHRDGERWVAWTPQGYYMASETGDDLIGWQINRGRSRTPDFIDNAQLAQLFYRPDLVSGALTGRSSPEAPEVGRVLTGGLPPTVEILSPRDGDRVAGETVRVRYRVADRGRGVGPVRVFLNGTAVRSGGERGIARRRKRETAEVGELSLDLIPGRENQIGLVAYDAAEALKSEEASVVVVSRASARKPRFFALSVGIDSFANPDLRLRFARSDAEAIAGKLAERVPASLFRAREIRLLVDAEASAERIRKEMDRLKAEASPEDVVMVFMATHGTMRENQYYMLTAGTGYLMTEDLKRTGITGRELRDRLAEIPASKKLLVLDTCKAGKVAMDLTRSISESTTLELLSRAVGSYIIAASTETQFANEGYRNHGLFSYVLLEGLGGAADLDGNGLVEVDELKLHVKRQVPELAQQVFGRRQFPTASGMGQSFPLVGLR